MSSVFNELRADAPLLGQDSALAALRIECLRIAPFKAEDLPAFKPPKPGMGYGRRREER